MKKIITKCMVFLLMFCIFSCSVSAYFEVDMYREKVKWPDKEDSSYDRGVFWYGYDEADKKEIVVSLNDIDVAIDWGYKTIDEYDENEKVTLYYWDFSDSEVEMVTIPKFLKEKYLRDGWFEDSETVTLYFLDPRFYYDPQFDEEETITIPKSLKEEYLEMGWYENNEKVTLYDTEKEITIPKHLKESYLKEGWCESLITLYAPGNRTLGVAPQDKQTYLNLGWYERPVTTLYALDGRQSTFYNEEVEAQCTVGWYKEKPVLLYTLDGRQQYFLSSEVEAQCTVGWYKKKPVTMYTLDGRSQAFPENEVAAQHTVGWYYQDEIEKIRSFRVGQRVWLNPQSARYPVGYITAINGSNISVIWDRIYDYDWNLVWGQRDIEIAEIIAKVTLGKEYTYSFEKISHYK